MFWAGAGGALVGAAGSLFSGKQSADFAENSFKHRYQWQVKDLQKAGLNPMLAVSQGPGNVPQPTFPNAGDAAVKGFSAGQMAQLQKEQIKNVQADTNLKYAQASATIAPTLEGQARVPHAAYRAQVEADRAREELTKLGFEMDKLNTSADLDRQNLENNKELMALVNEYRRLVNQAEEYGLSEAKATADFWKAIPEGKFLQALKHLIFGSGRVIGPLR